jgi:nucleotide-binding universal stress UspA family protein
MKPILFATNYSTASDNAGDYAAQLAKLCDAPLVVLHSWTLPVMTPEDAVLIPPPKEFHERELRAIEKEVVRLRTRWGIQVTGIESNNYTPDEIETLTRDQDISLVVLGMHHHNFCSRLLGSVATAALHKAGHAVLLVPDSYRFTPPEKILMAADKEQKMDDHSLDTLKLLVRHMKARLELVYVSSPAELWTVNETPVIIQLEHSLRQIPHQWNIEINDDVPQGIQHAAQLASADWIAVIPRHFSWFEELFRRGISDKLAYTTDRPLLILPAVPATHQP